MYEFNPHITTFSQPRPIVSFALPPWSIGTLPPSIQIRCAPTPTLAQTNSVSSPKVFDLAPDNRLICLHIHNPFSLIPGFSEPIGLLCIPSSILFDAISKHSGEVRPASIPWSDWGEGTSWIDTENIHQLAVFGQRVAGLETGGADSASIIIFDFDQQRVKAQAVLEAEVSGEACAPGNRDRVPSEAEMVFCAGKTHASKKYVKTFIPFEEGTDTADISITLDEEHSEYMRTLELPPELTIATFSNSSEGNV